MALLIVCGGASCRWNAACAVFASARGASAYAKKKRLDRKFQKDERRLISEARAAIARGAWRTHLYRTRSALTEMNRSPAALDFRSRMMRVAAAIGELERRPETIQAMHQVNTAASQLKRAEQDWTDNTD
jgi:hypothetical protein